MASWFQQNPKKSGILVFLVFFLPIEILFRILAYSDVVRYAPYRTTRQPAYLADIDPHFGVWHYPNASYRHFKTCYDVVYRSNAFGARDVERSLESNASRRFVVLGDSMVEGMGVEAEQRMTNLLEAKTGVEFLNFGTFGKFGSVQEWQLYKYLAKRFTHTDVLLFMLPDNDFRDNDPRIKGQIKKRYRPYLVETHAPDSTGFKLIYPSSFEDRPRPKLNIGELTRNWISNQSYALNFTRNALRTLRYLRELADLPEAQREESSYTERLPYDDFSEADERILLESYRRLIEEELGDRHLWLFTVPRQRDLAYYLDHGYALRLPKILAAFADHYPNVTYVDLLPILGNYTKEHDISLHDVFLSCDGHWSPLGNAIVADAVSEEIFP